MDHITTHYLDGRFVESHGRRPMPIVSPVTGEPLGDGLLADLTDARAAVRAARAALPAWSATTVATRQRYLRQLADAVSRHRDELASTMSTEYGAIAAFSGFVVDAARDWYLQAAQLLDDFPFAERVNNAVVRRVPVGVAALITPWNGSAWFMAMKSAAALAAGCTVVMKPSENSILQSQAFARVVHDAGLPPGVVNILYGLGDDVGTSLATDPDVDKISFTGSTAVGKIIARNAAGTMKRVTLELGGKAPIVVLDDADLPRAVEFGLRVWLYNSGQACTSGTRLLVPAHRLAEVKELILAKIGAFKVGLPHDPSSRVGPMVTRAHYERVQAYIQRGLDEGATLLVGGQGKVPGLASGNYARPTVFVDVKPDMTIAQEEIFGPVLAVIPYAGDAEAVDIANGTDYGLVAYVAGPPSHASVVASQIRAGRVVINEPVSDQDAPFGGFKQSGIGREFGRFGIEEYLEYSAVFSA
ncbi:aldehyde dehydrogenase family protein [Actinoplanes sp. TBRC 11911]|uniref:aldehyde dehydrogenase family protein n=1 Tax=Actinoplanes sp. TBRC 11911 TaxID=2729386 RepID=UPI00145E2443|nr:aldehyde dehydrogenase family protein [Actinoplanes sp. TBRC 11911]NMO51832.1 aldehyde dehydrogenase family protein [Actinoplanes sp. TBRC 11911]